MSDQEFEHSPLAYAIDNMILMHRDAHFGGSFSVMFNYYKNEGRGAIPEFDLRRIEELYELEQEKEANLAALTLSGPEAEAVGRSRQLYKQLRDLYEIKTEKAKNNIPCLIADLILAENEELESAMHAIIAEKQIIVPSLISLLRNEEFYSPFNPGYGQAPLLAAECLGKIGDKRAMISLFEAIGNDDFFNEDILLTALHAIGEPAKKFLIGILRSKPINHDNERAAIALLKFKDDPEVTLTVLDLLTHIDLKAHTLFATYLIFICEGLKTESECATFIALKDHANLPKELKREIETIIKTLH